MALVSHEAMEAYDKIKFKKEKRWIVFKAHNLNIVPDKEGDRKERHSDMLKALPGSNCRYVLFDYETEEALGRSVSKLYFIMWTPENANDQDRVTYTQALPIFKEKLSGIVFASASDKDELKILFEKERYHS
jgi:cofilin